MKYKMTEGKKTEVKRFYVPGVILPSICPGCGERVEKDLGKRYLDYPVTGVNLLYFYHECDDEEDCEWEVPFKFEISIEVDMKALQDTKRLER